MSGDPAAATFVESLADADVAALKRLIKDKYMIVSLTGFMGCGKSSVGRRLSELLCCRYIDLDSVIEERAGRSIPEIFATEGEPSFRAMELEALRSILTTSDPMSILSLGGGTVMTKECAESVHQDTKCFYLRASTDTLVRNLGGEAERRPMLATSDGWKSASDSESRLRVCIEELMAKRSATYESTAHIIIDTDGKTIDCIAEAILSEL